MIEVGTKIIGKNGKEGVVVFNPFNREEGTVSIDYGLGLSIRVEAIKDLRILDKVKVEADERCETCIFNNVYGYPCARYTKRRFIALHGEYSPERKGVPVKPYPECKSDMRIADRNKAV